MSVTHEKYLPKNLVVCEKMHNFALAYNKHVHHVVRAHVSRSQSLTAAIFMRLRMNETHWSECSLRNILHPLTTDMFVVSSAKAPLYFCANTLTYGCKRVTIMLHTTVIKMPEANALDINTYADCLFSVNMDGTPAIAHHHLVINPEPDHMVILDFEDADQVDAVLDALTQMKEYMEMADTKICEAEYGKEATL